MSSANELRGEAEQKRRELVARSLMHMTPADLKDHVTYYVMYQEGTDFVSIAGIFIVPPHATKKFNPLLFEVCKDIGAIDLIEGVDKVQEGTPIILHDEIPSGAFYLSIMRVSEAFISRFTSVIRAHGFGGDS